MRLQLTRADGAIAECELANLTTKSLFLETKEGLVFGEIVTLKLGNLQFEGFVAYADSDVGAVLTIEPDAVAEAAIRELQGLSPKRGRTKDSGPPLLSSDLLMPSQQEAQPQPQPAPAPQPRAASTPGLPRAKRTKSAVHSGPPRSARSSGLPAPRPASGGGRPAPRATSSSGLPAPRRSSTAGAQTPAPRSPSVAPRPRVASAPNNEPAPRQPSKRMRSGVSTPPAALPKPISEGATIIPPPPTQDVVAAVSEHSAEPFESSTNVDDDLPAALHQKTDPEHVFEVEGLPELSDDGTLSFFTATDYANQFVSDIAHGGFMARSKPLPIGAQKMVHVAVPGCVATVSVSARVGFVGKGTVGLMIDSFAKHRSKFEALLAEVSN